MTPAAPLSLVAVLDAAGAAADRHGRALGGFLRDGLSLGEDVRLTTRTLVLAAEGVHAGHALAPTRDVKLVPVPPHRPDVAAGALAAFQARVGADLFVLPGGPSGTELAARLAARTGGSVLTGVLSATVAGGVLTCRRAAYAGYLNGTFALSPRPWCIVLDASWDEARAEPSEEHMVEAAPPASGDASTPPPLLEIEPLEAPATGDLETARFLVVVGRGAGSRRGVERAAAAGARMGAAFGVTRPVVMNAWADPDRQVGASGTRAAPAVCIVAGASGAPAFIWGIERSRFIAAVDTDDHAPIAGEADVFVPGDGLAVLEALADLLDRHSP